MYYNDIHLDTMHGCWFAGFNCIQKNHNTFSIKICWSQWAQTLNSKIHANLIAIRNSAIKVLQCNKCGSKVKNREFFFSGPHYWRRYWAVIQELVANSNTGHIANRKYHKHVLHRHLREKRQTRNRNALAIWRWLAQCQWQLLICLSILFFCFFSFFFPLILLQTISPIEFIIKLIQSLCDKIDAFISIMLLNEYFKYFLWKDEMIAPHRPSQPTKQ